MDRQYSYAASEPPADIEHALAKLRESGARPRFGGGGLGSDPPHGSIRQEAGSSHRATSRDPAPPADHRRGDEVPVFGHMSSSYVRGQNGRIGAHGAPLIVGKVAEKIAKQTIGTITAEFSIVVAVAAFVSSIVSAITVDRAIHVAPAMTFRDIAVVNSPIKQGEPAVVSYEYDKRADCYPPKGDGDFYYRVYTQDLDGKFRLFHRLERGLNSQEPPGDRLKALNSVPLPLLPPGQYALTFRAKFKCAGETEEQDITTDKIPLIIVK